MYYLAKFFELVGIAVIMLAFFLNYPDPMQYNTLLYGVIFFMGGWIIERFFVTFIPMSIFGYLYLLFARRDDDDPISRKNLFFAIGFIIGVPLSQREDA